MVCWAAWALPEGGERLASAAVLAPDAIAVRHGNGTFANSDVRRSKHAEFATSLLLTVTKQPPNHWDAGLSIKTTGATRKGDLLLVGFWARGKSAMGGGITEFAFERSGAPYTKSIQYLLETPRDGSWQQVWVRFRAAEDYAAGGAALHFQTGFVPCTLEVGGLQAWNFGQEVEAKTLPHTNLSYIGRRADAPWRKAAAARIERHRKGDLVVTVTDAQGRPRVGVPVQIAMDRLAFDMGSALRLSAFFGEDQRYRQTFARHFNLAVIENSMKWENWAGKSQARSRSMKALHWLREQQIPARGHVMVWPGHSYLPAWVHGIDDPARLRPVVDSRIREVAFAAGPLVRDWDVLNELYSNRHLTNILGKKEVVHWFKVAAESAPHARLYYNDYAGLVRGGFPTTHKAHFEETLRYLIDNDAPIDGIGIQGHFGSLLTPPDRLYRELNRWAALDRDILITEFDVTVPDTQLQADFLRDFMLICFSHPRVKGVVNWGFWAKAHWRPDAALFDANWNPTLLGKAWVKLRNEWQTNATRKADASGQVKLRAFRGDYRISSGPSELLLTHDKPESTVQLAY